MNQTLGTILFSAAILGNALALAAGTVIGFYVLARREIVAIRQRQLVAFHASSAFHHPDRISTPMSEWIFMAVACAAVLVGLPVALAAVFEFGLPMLGRAFSR